MASIERHGNGFRAVFWTNGRGSKRQKTQVFARKSEALAAARRLSVMVKAKKKIGIGAVLSWEELIERYKIRLAERKQGAHRYPAEVENSLKKLIANRGWRNVEDVNPGNVGELRVSEHRYLKAILRFAELLGQPVDARCTRLVAPKRKKKPQKPLLTDDEIKSLMERARRFSPFLEAAGHLVATYGHRPQSLAVMECGDVRLNDSPPTIAMPVKSGDFIQHPIMEETVKLLRPLVTGRGIKERALLRPDGENWKDGDALSGFWYHQVGEWVCPDRPGMYELKRRAISRLLAAGMDVATIASITGHRTPSVILTYARTNDERQKAAIVALEKMVTPK
jgi:integrase